MGWCVEGVCALMDEDRLPRRGLHPSIFMLSGIWYFTESFSSILVAGEDGDAAPGSGDASLGGVGGNVYRWELGWWDGGVREDAELLLLHG